MDTTERSTMKLKDALVKDGFLKEGQAGRGRPSKAMIQRAKELVAEGWDIDGFSATPTKDADKPAQVTHKPTSNEGKVIVDLPDQMRGEDLVPIMPDGKVWPLGIKGICQTCKQSLTHCPCPSPVVLLDYKTTGTVTFRPSVKS